LLFAGKRNISTQLALKIGKFSGTSAEYWYGMQTAYDLQKARLEEQPSNLCHPFKIITEYE